MQVTTNGGLLPIGGRTYVSVEEISNIEEEGVKLGISKLLMMENAGNAVAGLVSDLNDGGRARVCLLAGTGNNGGDIFVAARHLSFWADRFKITLFLIGTEFDIHSREARRNWRILENIPEVRRIRIESLDDILMIKNSLKNCDIAVIGLFGTGFKGVPRDLALNVIQVINGFKGPTKISVDLPSGMEADSGEYRDAIRSDFTITMHAPKKGFLLDSAKQICGKVLIANIGLPK